jgi:hypothetical protein
MKIKHFHEKKGARNFYTSIFKAEPDTDRTMAERGLNRRSVSEHWHYHEERTTSSTHLHKWRYQNMMATFFLGLMILFCVSIVTIYVQLVNLQAIAAISTLSEEYIEKPIIRGILSLQNNTSNGPWKWKERARQKSSCQDGTLISPEDLSRNKKLLSHIQVDDNNKILYCFVPKVACTNWKTIMVSRPNADVFV